MGRNDAELVAGEWVTFPGGELEGKRPKALCGACREALGAAALQGWKGRFRRTLCFQCYRADIERDRALLAAGTLDTASAQRFQSQLPFEPVNKPRLDALKADRARARAATPPLTGKRRHAQIEARRALAGIAEGLRARGLAAADRDRVIFQAAHAVELQLPEAWVPFVMSR